MTAKHKIPTYRFKGYDGMWEEKKLGEVSDYYNGNAYEEFVNSKGPFQLVTLKSVDMDGNLISSGKFIDGNFPTLNHGTLVMILSEQSPGLLGMTSIIPNDNRFILNQRVAEIRPSKNVNSQFLSKAINLHQRYFGKHGAGTKVQNISKRSVTNFKLSLPSLPEQKAIGTFFSTLDQHITLHQRKLDTLKEQKKTYLKLLFPVKGQTKPALRFQGFEDDWEEVKLGEVVEKSGSGGTPKSTNKAYYGGNIPFLSITDITQSGKYITNTEKTLTEIGLENSSAWIVPKGAISLAMYASVGKLAILKTDVATSQAFFNMVFSNEIVRDYVYFILDKAQLFNEWLPLISTGTQGNLNAQKLKEYIIPLPTLPEQEAIGTFFQTLDQEIAQVEDKLASLKEMKKTLLRKLFV